MKVLVCETICVTHLATQRPKLLQVMEQAGGVSSSQCSGSTEMVCGFP